MKKLYYLIVLTLILGMVLTGCTLLSNISQVPTTGQSGMINLTKGGSSEIPLIAGQTEEVGTVYVSNDADYLYVKYFITDLDWCLTETHVHVGEDLVDFPLAGRHGNPVPGQFDYSDPHGCILEYTYMIPLDGEWGDNLLIAAHAVVEREECEVLINAPYGAYTVTEFTQGLRKDNTAVRIGRSVPDAVLTWDTNKLETDFFSLGFGGEITVEFDCCIANGEGPDVLVVEDTWGTYPLETAEVYASVDNIDWVLLGEANNLTRDITNNWQTVSEFELGDLECVKYIKVVDTTDPDPLSDDADGYDLNTILALQDCVQCTTYDETAWAYGDRFTEQGNWATYFDYIVTEGVLEVTQDSGQNAINQSLAHPYISWTIDGLCIEIVFVNPTVYTWGFNYRVDGEAGVIGPWSSFIISGGELVGQEIGPSYNIVSFPKGEPGLTKTVHVCAEEEVWVGLRLGDENDWFLDWIKFEAKW